MNKSDYISLLCALIEIPSFSGEEEKTSVVIEDFLKQRFEEVTRIGNNLVVCNQHFDKRKATVVLNSHHDTVKPNSSWMFPPFKASREKGKIIGLGSNDAGASLVSLIATFEHFDQKNLNYNLVLIASAEEENSGKNGIQSVFPHLDFEVDLAIVGEPTEMHLAIAEKGLLVIDGIAKGESGHAARPNGKNAIDLAIKDIEKIHKLEFSKVSDFLGPVLKSVTQIQAGVQHNVIPDECRFVIDVRVNEMYTIEQIYEALKSSCESELTARSLDKKSSRIDPDHALVKIAKSLGMKTFGSPTMSDQVHFACPSVKIGPGQSERSHQADEYIYISEIEDGIDKYISLLTPYLVEKN